jgi:hypothetical protein
MKLRFVVVMVVTGIVLTANQGVAANSVSVKSALPATPMAASTYPKGVIRPALVTPPTVTLPASPTGNRVVKPVTEPYPPARTKPKQKTTTVFNA